MFYNSPHNFDQKLSHFEIDSLSKRFKNYPIVFFFKVLCETVIFDKKFLDNCT